MMNHQDKYKTKRFDTAGRCREFTDIVYGVISEDIISVMLTLIIPYAIIG